MSEGGGQKSCCECPSEKGLAVGCCCSCHLPDPHAQGDAPKEKGGTAISESTTATLVCFSCYAEWRAAGHFEPDRDEGALFCPDERQVCPDCGGDDWGYDEEPEGGG